MQNTGYRRDDVCEANGIGSIKRALEVVPSPAQDSLPHGPSSSSSLMSDVQTDDTEIKVTPQKREKAHATYVQPVVVSHMTAEHERMIVEHLPTVRYLARRIHERLPHHVEIDDLVSAGVLGLIDAFQKFDPAKKVQFRSYAQFRIRGAILDSLRTLDWSPRDLRRKGRAVEEAIRTLTSQRGHAPSETEVAAELEMELGEYQQLL